MFNLSKNFRFESAHRLAKGYEGKCANIHGHSWNGKIEVEVAGVDEMGLSIDFKDLGKFTKEVEAIFDHKILLYENDKEIINLCKNNNWEFVVFGDNPTCEVVARWIYAKAATFFPSHVKVTSVTINETCTTACKFYIPQ